MRRLSHWLFGMMTVLAFPVRGVEADQDNAIEDARRAAGRVIFFDTRLSLDGTVSCSSCHDSDKAFTDSLRRSVGVLGRQGTRNAPTLLAVPSMQRFNWDGRTDTLVNQVLQPFVTDVEHGLPSLDVLVNFVNGDSGYRSVFTPLLGERVDVIGTSDIAHALSAYIASVSRTPTRLDRFLFHGDPEALSDKAQRGLALFRTTAGCAQCHQINESSAPLSDGNFHSLGVGLQQDLAQLPVALQRVEDTPAAQMSQVVLADPGVAMLGHYVASRSPADVGRFRTPSLRAVAKTAPYFHDGSVSTLREALLIELYYRNDTNRVGSRLSPEEQEELLEFLQSLDD